MRIDSTPRLGDEQVAAVLALVDEATTSDGVRPLSEQSVLDVRRSHTPAGAAVLHLLGYDGTRLVGYAHLERGSAEQETQDEPAASAELVVRPDRRRAGSGRAMLDRLLELAPAVRVWAHGDLDGARALAASARLSSVRELWQMRRPLAGEWSELPGVDLPTGFAARAFEPGRDEQPWLEVNARAFADHPEQGRTTRSDLEDRKAEPWFDPKGFILVEDVSGERPGRAAAPVLAAFHWTKVERSAGTGPGGHHRPATNGEVYVVGVDPSYQGRGLGKVITVLGLTHLRDRGLQTATLYVEGDNGAAIATYNRLGFERTTIDVMYARD